MSESVFRQKTIGLLWSTFHVAFRKEQHKNEWLYFSILKYTVYNIIYFIVFLLERIIMLVYTFMDINKSNTNYISKRHATWVNFSKKYVYGHFIRC